MQVHVCPDIVLYISASDAIRPIQSDSSPPTSSTAGFCRSRPNCCLSLCLEGSFWLKAGLMGKPCTVTLCCPIPIFKARAFASSVATKQRSTSLWNQVLWHVVKSVTTVANLMSLWSPALQCDSLLEMGLVSQALGKLTEPAGNAALHAAGTGKKRMSCIACTGPKCSW